MQKQLEALEQEIANAQERLRIAQEDLRQAIQAEEVGLRLYEDHARYCWARLEGLQAALEIMMLTEE